MSLSLQRPRFKDTMFLAPAGDVVVWLCGCGCVNGSEGGCRREVFLKLYGDRRKGDVP